MESINEGNAMTTYAVEFAGQVYTRKSEATYRWAALHADGRVSFHGKLAGAHDSAGSFAEVAEVHEATAEDLRLARLQKAAEKRQRAQRAAEFDARMKAL